MVNRCCCIFFFLLLVTLGMAQRRDWHVVAEHKQKTFPATVEAGNYSGITPLGGNRYAVVDDKAPQDGFVVMRIDVDSLSGDIKSVVAERRISNGLPPRDAEGIVYMPSSHLIYICGETDNQVLAYDMDGKRTGDSLSLPEAFDCMGHLYGLESLAYDSLSHRFFVANESTLPIDGEQATATNGVANKVRIVGIGEDRHVLFELLYPMDAPVSHGAARNYAMGVSEVLSLPDGQLLVLERELWVPKRLIGAFVNCKLYIVDIEQSFQDRIDGGKGIPIGKRLLTQWRTKLNITSRSWANYEGMCLGPTLADGSQVVLLVSDSQNQYAGVLGDWWKSIVIR